MINHHRRSAPSSRTCPTRRPQPEVADLADERWIALPVTQSGHFVEQSGSPKVGVVGQPLPNISLEGIERIRLGRPPPARHVLTTQVSTHCFAVSSHMAGNSPHRPASLPQRVYFHVFLLCQHQGQGSSPRCRISQSAAWRGPHSTSGICRHRVGIFSDRVWGFSMIVNTRGGSGAWPIVDARSTRRDLPSISTGDLFGACWESRPGRFPRLPLPGSGHRGACLPLHAHPTPGPLPQSVLDPRR